MADLFGEYELLAQSGLFDAEYYVGANPDVAALSIDPLMHYLEKGASELRDPSGYFDAHHYIRICEQRGEHVDNPLLHYIKYGATQGLTAHPDEDTKDRAVARATTAPLVIPAAPVEFLLDLDQVRIESSGGVGRLIGIGWCLAAHPIIELGVALGAVRARARYGLPRADVALTYPQYLKSDHSGFEFSLGPIPEFQTGIVGLTFSVATAFGSPVGKSISIDLDSIRAATDQSNATGVDSVRSGFGRPPMQLCVDAAEVDDAGILHILGWAVCLAPISSVQVLIDGEGFGAADYGHAREDVALSHPEYPNAHHSGFVLHADISSLGDGDRVIKVQAVASTGITRETILPFTFSAKRRGSLRDREDGKVQFSCDFIEITNGGRVSINGWAVAAAPTQRISVLLDGNELGDAELGIERPDVGNHFPQLAHARKSGFSFRCSTRAVSEGEHIVILRCRANGADTDIPLPILAAPGSAIDAGGSTPVESPENERLLSIDLPKTIDGEVVNPIRGSLEIAGWALARQGIDRIDVLIDGQRLTTTNTGIRRTDVQSALPDWEGALTAGFSTVLPHRSLPQGAHTVTVEMHDRSGQVVKTEFKIAVENAPDADGPWAIRRRMSPAEIDLLSLPLLSGGQRPSIAILLAMPTGVKALEETRATLVTLASQVYGNWCIHVVTTSRTPATVRRALLKGLGELSQRVDLQSGVVTLKKVLGADNTSSHVMVLRPGDDLGCDAILEFAVQTVLHPKADFIYSDDRRLDKASGKVNAFFKPQWSPDLLLSQNYLGRAWCASTTLLRKAGIRANELMSSGSYHLALRLTEHATEIRHVPATLLQASTAFDDESAEERTALERAVNRRKIAAVVEPGRAPGTFRVRRKVTTHALVSIIIPTCAARGLIRRCIESLRSLTKYRDFEIVCIENIPGDKQEWKHWVRANADRTVETSDSFNWSRFNNLAVVASRGDFLVFLNDDTEIVDPAWLDVLLESAQRPEVGAVGPQLLYPDRRVQHAGTFLSGMGVARHAFRFAAEDDPGYFGLALTQRQLIAVTGACLMTRRAVFEAIGGFDERHDVVNNDIDYCLRVWRSGLRTIYTPHTTLIHHEMVSRSEIADRYNMTAFLKEWRSVCVGGDPFFHPRLAKDRDDYSFEWEPVEVHCVGSPLLPHEAIRRILVVKLDHIGDCVTSLPAIRRLRRLFPAATLCVLTGRASKAVWAMEPAVNKVIEFDFFNARSASGLVEHSEDDWRELRERLVPYRFDLAVDLRKHWETRSVLRHTGARYFAGFDMKGKFPWLDVAVEWSEDTPLLRKRQHTTGDLVNLVDAIAAACESDRTVIAEMPAAIMQETYANVPALRRIFRKRVVCVHASVGNEMRQWPAEYFSLLIDQLIDIESVHVILVGAPDETTVGREVLKAISNRRSVWSLIGRLTLGELPAVIGRCALFVGNNSGPHHIAAGLGVPTVGIHSGVVDAREWGPKGNTAVAIDRVMTCSPCYREKLEDCGRGLACMRGLLPADVMLVCQRLLAHPGAERELAATGHGNRLS